MILLAISLLLILGQGLSGTPDGSEESEAPVSEQTEECLECHQVYTPGIVEDWRTSEHSRMTPAESLKKPDLEKKVSNPKMPKELLEVTVGCYECHSRNPEKHRDNFKHFGHQINVVVSPKDCSTCHVEEEKQYSSSKKANAHYNLAENPVYHTLVETITSLKEVNNGQINQLESSDYTKAETCYSCHGTKVEVKGTKVIKTDIDDIEVPVLTN